VQLLRKQEQLGQVAGLDVAAQEAALAQAEASLPPLRKQLELQRDMLKALAGGLQSVELAEKFDLASLQLPQELPVSVPAKLVLQRPDMRQAEANLHAASAEIGVAIANRLPNIALTADAGTTALTLDKLFASGSSFWTLAGSVTQPLFDGGTLLHKERAAREVFEQARAQYRSTLVTGFQNVADALHALQTDGVALQAAVAAEQAARTSFEITRKQLRLGAVNYLSLLNAQQTYLNAVVALAVARGNRFADTAALFQALGGGWWNRSDVLAQL
jgi:NodT family efflux transporter outer membrane factor (OMF) lipoprotein